MAYKHLGHFWIFPFVLSVITKDLLPISSFMCLGARGQGVPGPEVLTSRGASESPGAR